MRVSGSGNRRSSEGQKPTGIVDVRLASFNEIVVHYRDGYVVHHTIGQKRSDEKVVLVHPLDVSKIGGFTVSSTDDPAFSSGVHPSKVFRKTKGTDFAWFADRWVNGAAVNDRPDYAAEHWLYLPLPSPVKLGHTYRISSPALGIDCALETSGTGLVSDSVHVNLLGYRPDALYKFAYVYSWQGDGGSQDVQLLAGHDFEVIDSGTGKAVFRGVVKFRKDRMNRETEVDNDTPNHNFLSADVAECDFSTLNRPGQYFVQIEGVGRSRTFSIASDVYRVAFETTMKGILGNRSGIELKRPYVSYVRPAPHNPLLTPGFAGHLKYTRSRNLDRKNADASPEDKPAVEAGIVGDLTVSGWYQDAGDWDSYESHIQVPWHLMLCHQIAGDNFSAGDLKLPDASSGLPGILTEARWLPSFCYRLRHQLLEKHYGTGGIGLRICGDHFGGDTGPKDIGLGSWQDVDRVWTASGEDPVSTFGYAAISAHFQICLNSIHQSDPQKIDWTREAREAFDWAEANTRPGDESKPDYREYRTYALCSLAALTGDTKYTDLLLKETAGYNDGTRLWWSALDGPSVYLVSPGPKNPVLVERFTKALMIVANLEYQSAEKRALRWAGDSWMPMLVGQQTTPWVEALAIASYLTRKSDPGLSKRYFSAVETTADYFLGTNPLNQTWVSGLTDRSPINIFHLDNWYEEGVHPRPGVVPYGPWRSEHATGQGPWDHDWANKSVYPPVDQWPGAERWFENRCCPLTNEFTVWQNIAPSAFTYGFLCGSR